MILLKVLLALVTTGAQAARLRREGTLCGTTCPDDWIRVFWDVLTLKDGRMSVGRDDVDRLFYAMDYNADDAVTVDEFGPFWKDCTLICTRDVMAIFRIFTEEHLEQGELITKDKLFAVFNLDGGDLITKEEFDRMWYQMLDRLPNKGCPLTTSPPFSCPVFLG